MLAREWSGGASGRPEPVAAGWAAKHSGPIASQQRYVIHRHQQKARVRTDTPPNSLSNLDAMNQLMTEINTEKETKLYTLSTNTLNIRTAFSVV